MPPPKTVDVSVVIPSVGRPELKRAIESVLAQNFQGKAEIIVAFDLAETSGSNQLVGLSAGADVVLFTGGRRRGGFTRNLGVAAASGQWIAFLDDDDLWHPDKLRLQMNAASTLSADLPVIGCRAVQSITGATSVQKVSGVPGRLISPGEHIADYLFRRRRAGSSRASFFASTVLAPRDLCLQVPWDETLTRHQDWDWLVKLGQFPSVTFHQLNEELVDIFVGTSGSISAGSDWETSLKWSKLALSNCDTQTRVDFLAGQTLRYAVQKRDLNGIRESTKEILRLRRVPSLAPLILGVSGVLPRKWLQSLMRVFK